MVSYKKVYRQLEKRIVEITGIIIVIGILLFVGLTDDYGAVTLKDNVKIMEGWRAIEGHPDSGGTFVISNTIPEEMETGEAIVFRSQQQKVKVLVGEQVIYQYPEKRLLGDCVPSVWNFIELPEDSGGKEIQIQFHSPYKMFDGKIGSIYYGTYHELFYKIHGMQLPVLLISASIGVAGACLILLTIILRKYRRALTEKRLGLLLVFVSLWLCGESKMPFLHIGVEAQYYITFISLMLCAPFYLLYLQARVKGRYERVTKKLLVCSIVEVFVFMALRLTGVRKLMELMSLVHVSLAFCLIYGIFIYGRKVIKKEKGYSAIEFSCMLLIIFSILVEIVLFYIDRYQILGIYIRISFLIYTVYLVGVSIRKIYETFLRNVRLSEQLQKSKTALMISQIKPHFIYNTLGSIRTLIKISPEKAYDMVYDFSVYLRANIDSMGTREKILFSDELRHVKAYVNIEKVRFEDRLEVVFDIQEEGFYLPPLSVQALVENAIKHGICKKPEGGCVWIRSYETEEYYIAEVEDNGIGFDPENVKSGKSNSNSNSKNESVGLQNIEFRLREITGAEFEIISKEGQDGTKAIIKCPKR